MTPLRPLRLLLTLLLPLVLAACGASTVWAPDEEVARAAYVTGAPPSITLYTVISTNTGAGGHSSLLIDGTQRVLFDPAGTFYHPWVPERNDVLYGITEQMRKFYIDYHARETYFVRDQKLAVSLETAERLRAAVEAHGAAPKAFCANSVAQVLRTIPEFKDLPGGFSPVRLSAAFGALPGVVTHDHYDGDPANNSGVLMIEAERARELGIERPAGH